MRTRRAILVIGALLALAGCGAEDERPAERAEQSDPTPAATATATPTAAKQEATGTKLNVAQSEFGSMLFDSRKQAIYVFERDPEGKTVCYGDCAEAWPPVYTDGDPVAGKGVRAALLGTVKRRDGRLQVTYAGKPLYFYAHEGPGQVLCHNVNLNGGFWWVVAPSGERRA
jgi:predicted lipoprotein with Yx(FWY)xxD motif